MHSFWNLVKAEFVADTLTLILFGGKYPRILAVFLMILLISWYAFRGIIQLFFGLIFWVFVTENMKIKKQLKKVIRVGKPFGDSAEKIRYENSYWILRLSNPQFGRNIEHMEFWIAKKTGKLRIFTIRNETEAEELSYTTLQHLIPHDQSIMMHADYAAYIYSQLRHNYL